MAAKRAAGNRNVNILKLRAAEARPTVTATPAIGRYRYLNPRLFALTAPQAAGANAMAAKTSPSHPFLPLTAAAPKSNKSARPAPTQGAFMLDKVAVGVALKWGTMRLRYVEIILGSCDSVSVND